MCSAKSLKAIVVTATASLLIIMEKDDDQTSDHNFGGVISLRLWSNYFYTVGQNRGQAILDMLVPSKYV